MRIFAKTFDSKLTPPDTHAHTQSVSLIKPTNKRNVSWCVQIVQLAYVVIDGTCFAIQHACVTRINDGMLLMQLEGASYGARLRGKCLRKWCCMPKELKG